MSVAGFGYLLVLLNPKRRPGSVSTLSAWHFVCVIPWGSCPILPICEPSLMGYPTTFAEEFPTGPHGTPHTLPHRVTITKYVPYGFPWVHIGPIVSPNEGSRDLPRDVFENPMGHLTGRP